MQTIIGIKLENRIKDAIELQKIITEHGCSIGTRIGLHETYENDCVSAGLVILEVTDDKSEELYKKLSDKWECQKMVFKKRESH